MCHVVISERKIGMSPSLVGRSLLTAHDIIKLGLSQFLFQWQMLEGLAIKVGLGLKIESTGDALRIMISKIDK